MKHQIFTKDHEINYPKQIGNLFAYIPMSQLVAFSSHAGIDMANPIFNGQFSNRRNKCNCVPFNYKFRTILVGFSAFDLWKENSLYCIKDIFVI